MKKEYVLIPALWIATSLAFAWLLAHYSKPPNWEYYAFDVKVLLSIAFSQLVRAFRDAIDHNKGVRSLGRVWHYLYYPQAGALLFAGMLTTFAFPYLTRNYILALIGGLLLGWVVHKISLHYFRKLEFRKEWW